MKLFFLGLAHPNPAVPQMEMQRRALALADELGARDRVGVLQPGLGAVRARGAYFLEADVGVSAHLDGIETRFAYRTRLLDCFWAGLPVVCTRGDVLGDMVEERRLGRTVAPESVEDWVQALEGLLDDEGERAAIRERLAGVREELAWPRVVEPLRRLVAGATARGCASAVAHGRRVRGDPPRKRGARARRSRSRRAARRQGDRPPPPPRRPCEAAATLARS